MILEPIAQWGAFAVFAFIAVAGALGMATTMSMFRSGIFLMASFIGVAGLFILLSADLLSLLQVMMYIGGMLVMILFMVLFSHDPGGAMMAGMMELPPIERFFSLGLASNRHEHGDHADGRQQHHHSKGQDERNDKEKPEVGKQDHEAGEHGGMDMSDMSMTTPMKPYAAVLATLVGVLLVALLLLRPAWPVSPMTPGPYSAEQVGSLLMGKYMIAFEGAGLLILIGIFGAVLVSRPGQYPDAGRRHARVAVDAPPAQIAPEALEPVAGSDAGNEGSPVRSTETQRDDQEKGGRS